MLTMAKKKTKPEEQAQSEPEQVTNPSMSFRPSQAMRTAIESLAAKERRRPAQMIYLLLEDLLISRGLLPPLEESPE